jgi:nicotinamidase-related amidase
MKRILLLILIIAGILINLNGQGNRTALLIIDIQDFYFPGGKSELIEPQKAAENAAQLLKQFRNSSHIVVHVRHNSEPGGKINEAVTPLPSEKVISKDKVNCFAGTGLEEYLHIKNIDTLVICGMQTHMCVEAATRAATDLGFRCIVIHDACTTKDLKFGEKVIRAEDVHYSTLSTLRSYAIILSTSEFLKKQPH